MYIKINYMINRIISPVLRCYFKILFIGGSSPCKKKNKGSIFFIIIFFNLDSSHKIARIFMDKIFVGEIWETSQGTIWGQLDGYLLQFGGCHNRDKWVEAHIHKNKKVMSLVKLGQNSKLLRSSTCGMDGLYCKASSNFPFNKLAHIHVWTSLIVERLYENHHQQWTLAKTM